MPSEAEETTRWLASDAWTKVTIVDGRAIMPLGVFDDLDEYSCSLPSGTFVAKRWKRLEPFGGPGVWYLGEYVDDPDPKKIGILWRPIDITCAALNMTPTPATTANIQQIRAALKSMEALR